MKARERLNNSSLGLTEIEEEEGTLQSLRFHWLRFTDDVQFLLRGSRVRRKLTVSPPDSAPSDAPEI